MNGAGSAAGRESTIIAGRSPLLPLSAAYDLLAATDRGAVLAQMMREDPTIILAIYIASPSLARDLSRDLEGDKTSSRAIDKACRYVVRMATRSTPFGLFATIGNIALGDGATLPALSAGVVSRTRVDSAYLQRCIMEIEADPDLRRRLTFTSNDMVIQRGTRLTVLNPTATVQGPDGDTDYTHTSVRLAPVVRHVMERLRGRWLGFEDIQQSLVAEFGLSDDRTAALLEQFRLAGLILSELRISPTDDIAGRLERFADANAPALARLLRRTGAVLRALDRYPIAQRRPRQYAVVDAALQRIGAKSRTAIQLDARRDYSGTLPRAVADEIFRYGELVLAFSPKREFPRLRERFMRRFESDLPMVPLLEFAGSDVARGDVAGTEVDVPQWTRRRSALLMEKMLESARRGSIACELSDDDVAALTYPGDLEQEAPYAQELLVEIHAGSASELARGNYVIAPSEYFSIGEYGPALGRFSDLLGDDVLARMRKGVAAGATAPDAIPVELAYWPTWDRALNVMVRQPIREYELGLGVQNRSGGVERLAMDDVYVGLDEDRFFLWSASRRRRIELQETHLFSSHDAPPLIRFLMQVRSDGRRVVVPLGGGPFDTSPFFPRLTYGRFILTKARWTLSFDAAAGREVFDAGVRALRSSQGLPRRVTANDGDRKLLVDLDSDLGLEMLFDEAKRAGHPLMLEEHLPDVFGAWMESDKGRHALEVLATTIRPKPAHRPRRTPDVFGDQSARAVPPGEWLYFCMYCSEGDADHLLVGELAPALQRLREQGLLRKWFFLRYRDPDFHLRLRINVADARAQETVLGAFNELLSSLVRSRVLQKFTLATYFRELERYGGERGIELFESLFWHDSDGVIAELNRRPATRSDRYRAAMISIDPLVRGLLVGPDRVGEWLSANRPPLRKLTGEMWDDVRAVQNRLSQHDLASNGAAAMRSDWDAILATGAFERDEPLWFAFESVIHMHWNRFGIHHEGEHEVRSMLSSVYRGLASRRAAE